MVTYYEKLKMLGTSWFIVNMFRLVPVEGENAVLDLNWRK